MAFAFQGLARVEVLGVNGGDAVVGEVDDEVGDLFGDVAFHAAGL